MKNYAHQSVIYNRKESKVNFPSEREWLFMIYPYNGILQTDKKYNVGNYLKLHYIKIKYKTLLNNVNNTFLGRLEYALLFPLFYHYVFVSYLLSLYIFLIQEKSITEFIAIIYLEIICSGLFHIPRNYIMLNLRLHSKLSRTLKSKEPY